MDHAGGADLLLAPGRLRRRRRVDVRDERVDLGARERRRERGHLRRDPSLRDDVRRGRPAQPLEVLGQQRRTHRAVAIGAVAGRAMRHVEGARVGRRRRSHRRQCARAAGGLRERAAGQRDDQRRERDVHRPADRAAASARAWRVPRSASARRRAEPGTSAAWCRARAWLRGREPRSCPAPRGAVLARPLTSFPRPPPRAAAQPVRASIARKASRPAARRRPRCRFRRRQIAARVLGPGVAGELEGAHAGVAVADVEVGAGGAAALHRRAALLEAGHQRVGSVRPDGRERALAHIAERVVPPEGVRVDVAQVVDVGDVDARGVAAPLRELRAQVRRPARGSARAPSAAGRRRRRRCCR